MTCYEELKARGLIAQVTNEEEIRNVINNGKAVFYIGFDCTADSLTAGQRKLFLAYEEARNAAEGASEDAFARQAFLLAREVYR